MTERERLIELMQEWGNKNTDSFPFEKVADHLIANGVIVPSCKVGDKIYLPWEWKETSGVAVLTIERMSITESGQSVRTDFWSDDEDYWLAYNCGVFKFDEIGKTVFLTREEAEQALAERNEGI